MDFSDHRGAQLEVGKPENWRIHRGLPASMKAVLLRGAWLAVILLAVTGLLRLRFDVDVLNLLPDDIAAVQGLKLHQKYFANANELILAIEASVPEEAERVARGLAEHLRARPHLVRSAEWQPPWLENPTDAAEFIAYLWLNQPPEAFGQLTNRLMGTNVVVTLRSTQQRLATTFSPDELGRLPHDPFDLLTLPSPSANSTFNPDSGLFSSSDGLFRLIFVQATQPLANYRQAIAWTTQIQSAIRAWENAHGQGAKIQMTGGPAFTSEIAGGMQGEMSTSVLSTAVIIAALFWLVHRRWKPLVWLLALLVLILIGTLALGGWFIGELNVVSAGFAAILFGLADYGLVLYQEARAHPERSLQQIRRELSPSIFWSAVTTAGAFLLLNFSGLPGLGQLGTLVSMGVGLAAVVMVFAYLPVVADSARQPGPNFSMKAVSPGWSISLTFGLILSGIAVAAFMPPKVDYSSKPLRPRNSEAYSAMEQIRARLGQSDPYWLLIRGADEQQVAEKLNAAHSALQLYESTGKIAGFDLPVTVWPNPANQRQNQRTAREIAVSEPDLARAALDIGFTTNSLLLTQRILNHWNSPSGLWPTSRVSRWVLDRLAARTPNDAVALGLIYPSTLGLNELAAALQSKGASIAGWEALGGALFGVVRENFKFVVLPMLGLVAVTLGMAFRHPREIFLSLCTLALSLSTLLVVMRIAGWSWNMLNLLAIPLLFGAGVDYSIHVQAALRRHGDIAEVLRSTGQAILLVGGTTIAGFGSLAWSSNAGLVSLGLVTASGLCAAMGISVFLLPHWWKLLGGRADDTTISHPSKLYRAGLWRLGLRAVRLLPARLLTAKVRVLAWGYWACAKSRRSIVIENLIPVVRDRAAAQRATRTLFQHFAVKLVDLWRFESGENVDHLFRQFTGWEHFTTAHERGKGVLLLTAHLGNWEFGAPLLVSRGIRLYVITLAEPGEAFTALRQASRSRRGIETLVIGNDPFAFVEIIKKLQAGATIALLMDRPPVASAVTVELFGKPFKASAAAAELARASGCALVPVILPRIANGYSANVLPEVHYNRAALGKRDARIALTQEIMRAFEPPIREYVTQWYHFVPIWRADMS